MLQNRSTLLLTHPQLSQLNVEHNNAPSFVITTQKRTEIRGVIRDSDRVFCGCSSLAPGRPGTRLARSKIFSSSDRFELGANVALTAAAAGD